MYKIIIKGEAKTDCKNLSLLDGVSCQERFSDYFDDDDFYEEISGGYMRFSYEDGKLWTITEYDSNRLLSEEELQILADYTQGQWSDGIGEGFEQEPCLYDEDDDIYISAWFSGQELIIEQTKI